MIAPLFLYLFSVFPVTLSPSPEQDVQSVFFCIILLWFPHQPDVCTHSNFNLEKGSRACLVPIFNYTIFHYGVDKAVLIPQLLQSYSSGIHDSRRSSENQLPAAASTTHPDISRGPWPEGYRYIKPVCDAWVRTG